MNNQFKILFALACLGIGGAAFAKQSKRQLQYARRGPLTIEKACRMGVYTPKECRMKLLKRAEALAKKAEGLATEKPFSEKIAKPVVWYAEYVLEKENIGEAQRMLQDLLKMQTMFPTETSSDFYSGTIKKLQTFLSGKPVAPSIKPPAFDQNRANSLTTYASDVLKEGNREKAQWALAKLSKLKKKNPTEMNAPDYNEIIIKLEEFLGAPIPPTPPLPPTFDKGKAMNTVTEAMTLLSAGGEVDEIKAGTILAELRELQRLSPPEEVDLGRSIDSAISKLEELLSNVEQDI